MNEPTVSVMMRENDDDDTWTTGQVLVGIYHRYFRVTLAKVRDYLF